MKVVMLAAGVGRRLHGGENNHLPKALLRFGGKTLLARHIECLQGNGIDELVMVVGHRMEDLLAEADTVAPDGFVRTLFNPRYKESPILSLSTADEILRSGDDVLFMDADVLYHPDVLGRLINSRHRNCFIIDYEFEFGDEPVKLCFRDGELVDFGKQVTGDYHKIGEWPGFMRMSAEIAVKVADAVQTHVEDDNMAATYETAMRDVLVSEPAGTFGCENVTGIPWTEIDFPADVIYAEDVILPRMAEYEGETSVSPEAGLMAESPPT